MKPEELEQIKQSYPILPSEQFADKPIYNIPFTPELFDKVCMSLSIGKIKTLKQYPFRRMVDLLDVDYDRFRELGGSGLGKWALFQEVKQHPHHIDHNLLMLYPCNYLS